MKPRNFLAKPGIDLKLFINLEDIQAVRRIRFKLEVNTSESVTKLRILSTASALFSIYTCKTITERL